MDVCTVDEELIGPDRNNCATVTVSSSIVITAIEASVADDNNSFPFEPPPAPGRSTRSPPMPPAFAWPASLSAAPLPLEWGDRRRAKGELEPRFMSEGVLVSRRECTADEAMKAADATFAVPATVTAYIPVATLIGDATVFTVVASSGAITRTLSM